MASRVKEGIKELFSSKDDLDYPDQYLYQHRFQALNGQNTTLPVLELTVPMCCEKCQEKVKEELEELEGVRNVICDQYNQRVTVTGFVDPLKALRKVKKVKKKSAFFNNSTYINGTSLPIVRATNNVTGSVLPSSNGFSESRYTANPLVRANSSGFGRLPHEGRMAPMMQAPMLQQQLRPLQRVNSYDRRMYRQPSFGRVTRYDDRQANALAPVNLQRDYYGVRRMPSFKNHRYHDAEYISMGDEFRPSMTESHYFPQHNQRPALLRSQVSFSRLPVNNPHYMKHIESEMEWLWAVVLQMYPLAGPVMTFWYPLVASIMAIETRNKKDDQLWMTYWMLYALLSTVELIVAPAIPWNPFYSTVKLVVAAWLVLPQFRGGMVIYKELVHPYFSAGTKVTFTNGDHKWSTHISADANESAAVYIKKHGANAFEALMESATKSIKVEEAERVEKVEEIRRLF